MWLLSQVVCVVRSHRGCRVWRSSIGCRVLTISCGLGGVIMIGFVVLFGLVAMSAWALYTGVTPDIKYGQLTWGALGAWAALLLLWLRVPQRVRKSKHGWTAFVSYVVTLLLCVAPGIILASYGWLAPAVPSYTRGGVDVCDLEVGYCVSGTRAFIFLGGSSAVIGLIINWVINPAQMIFEKNHEQ